MWVSQQPAVLRRKKKKQLVLRVNNARKGPGFSERYKILKSNENCQEQCSYRCGIHNKYEEEEERGAKGKKKKRIDRIIKKKN